jgi:TRAP-type C4-dicarboxylate transport system permease small subunit
LLALIGVFMAVRGYRLCADTWNQSIAEFPSLSVGVTYLPIPLGGAGLVLFVIERLFCGPPPAPAADAHGGVPFFDEMGEPWKS